MLSFIVLLSFSSSLAKRRLSLHHEPCIARPTPIDVNPVALKYFRFMISLDKCIQKYPKICVPKKNKRHKC